MPNTVRPYLHRPALGLRIAGSAFVRARHIDGDQAILDAAEALDVLGERRPRDARIQFDRARFERTSGVAARDWSQSSASSTDGLALLALRRALDDADWRTTDVDVIVAATNTPAAITKSLAATLGKHLASPAAAVDVRAGGAGGLEAWIVAADRATVGARVVVVASERTSPYANPSDPTNALLFGDGAAALCLETGPGGGGLAFARSARYRSDGEPFSVTAGLPPRPDAEYVFGQPTPDYRDAIATAWRDEAVALRDAIARHGVEGAVAAPYFVHARQLDLVAAHTGLDVALARELLVDGGALGCAGSLAVVAAARNCGLIDRPFAALSVGGGIATCSLIWLPS